MKLISWSWLFVSLARERLHEVVHTEIKPSGRIDDMCKNTCSPTYGDGKCAADCRKAGFTSGRCATSFGNKCCCTK
ncbi:defensin-like protein 43 [Capsella rubella]|uniref:defensin-like protein 43 n=1 Tax=Capsella rubella TaxID=81985 RepID=UPI000CD4F573|nr:defensin-like protein 43 [Capsella rubella]